MRPGQAGPWRQLAPIALLVLAAHLLLLQGAPRRLEPGRTRPLPFATRTIVAAPAAAALPAAAHAQSAQPAQAAPPAAAAPQRSPQPAPPRPARAAALPPKRPAPAPAPVPAPSVGARDGAEATATTPPAPQATATPVVPPVLALPEPSSFHFEVSGHWNGIPLAGRARLDWRHDGRQYEARFEVTGPLASRLERSSGRITAGGLAPGYFAARGRRSEQATHFERESGRLVFSNNRPPAPLAEGMQDRLSVLVQLAALLAGAPGRYPPGSRIAIPTATTREAETWVFTVEGEEDLQLPGGMLPGLKLQRLPRKEFDQKVELWLAPRMDYAPVRLRLTNPNGDTVDHRWSSTDKG